MRTLRRLLSRLAAPATRRRDDERLREEVEEHLALQTAENLRAGMSPVEARRQAVLKFGPVEAVKERYRDERGLPFLEHLFRDLRYTLRQLRKSPLFTLTATLSLAAGIGANAAIFTVVDRILLRPLPVSHPEELVFVTDQRSLNEPSPRFSYPFYTLLRDNDALNGVAAHFVLPLNATMPERTARVRGELVSGNYFDVVGAGTQLGRPLTPQDDRTPGSHAVVVISNAFWQRSFGADHAVVGRDVRINNHTFTIIGVADKRFTGTDVGVPTDIWLPMMMQREVGRDLITEVRTNWLEMIGRLKSGVSVDRAAAELTAYVDRRAEGMQGQPRGRQLMLLPADKGSSGVRRELGPALKVLLALTGLALVLACVNLASLLVVRSVAREKEIAVRLALGARRSSLVRQFLTETLVLAAAGGTAGLLIAPWAAGLLLASQPGVSDIDPSLDMRVFLFGLGAWLLTGLFVGLAPVLASSKVGLEQAFAHSFRSTHGSRNRPTLHDVIVTCELAVSLVVLIGAALFVQSLRNLSSIDPGFRAEEMLLITVDPAAAGYDAGRREAFWRDTLDRVNQIHGVQSASLGRTVPMAPGRQRQPAFNPISGDNTAVDTNFVGPGYFRTLAIPLVRGREFSDRDGKTSRPVVIVNDRMARTFWPGQDPVGQAIRVGGSNSPMSEVVAVVRDVKYRDLRDEAVPMVYVPAFQTSSRDPMTLHVRTAGDSTDLIATIRREVQMLDANVPLFEIKTLEDQLNASFAQFRQAAVLTSAFGILALVLSGIGVYGVTALVVSRQTRHIGIRRALGAQPRHIIGAIGRRGLMLVVAGLSLGVLASLAFAGLARALLYGITPGDGTTFAGMAALLAAVSAIAMFIPTRAATRLDPLASIRYE